MWRVSVVLLPAVSVLAAVPTCEDDLCVPSSALSGNTLLQSRHILRESTHAESAVVKEEAKSMNHEEKLEAVAVQHRVATGGIPVAGAWATQSSAQKKAWLDSKLDEENRHHLVSREVAARQSPDPSDSGLESAKEHLAEQIASPKMCCTAMVASCLACQEGVTPVDYCSRHPSTSGCSKLEHVAEKTALVPHLCCTAMVASCLACKEGVTPDFYCRSHPSTVDCPKAEAHTADVPTKWLRIGAGLCAIEGRVASIIPGLVDRQHRTTMAGCGAACEQHKACRGYSFGKPDLCFLYKEVPSQVIPVAGVDQQCFAASPVKAAATRSTGLMAGATMLALTFSLVT